MIEFEKVTEQHYKAYKYDVLLSSIAIHKDKYVIHNRYSKLNVPKRLKKYLRYIIMDSYQKDLKTFELNKQTYNETEGGLSIKKMMKILKV